MAPAWRAAVGLFFGGAAAAAVLLGPAACRAAGSSAPAVLRALRLRLALQAAARWPFGAVLCRVRVPCGMLGESMAATVAATGDEEGLVTADLVLKGGKIVAVTAPGSAAAAAWGPLTVDAGGAVVFSLFVDCHVHLVKNHAVARNRNPSGSINDALLCEVNDHPRWTDPGDVARRMDFGLQSAYHHGTKLIRTHLDGTNHPDPALRALVYGAFDAARRRWLPRGLEVVGVANLYLLAWLDADNAAAHVAEAARHDGVVLGAYCGDVSLNSRQEVLAAFEALFENARKFGLDVDLHIDETNNPACNGVALLCEALEAARARGFRGGVVLGHCCALGLQSERDVREVIQKLTALGPVAVVANPTTNLGLQDRRGTEPPVGVAIDRETPRTPGWRGLTLLQELDAAGVVVAAATDNVRDWWHSFGDYDMLAVWFAALTVGHLDTAPNAGTWAHLVSRSPAAALGAGPCEIAPGGPADFILFPSASKLTELLARPQGDRIVVRGGRVQASALPAYRELEDLVREPVARVYSGKVVRGASKEL